MLNDIVKSAILAVAIIIAAVILRPLPVRFQTIGHDGIVYRLNQINGRLDVLVPTNEGALLMPVGQIAMPSSKVATADEKQKFSGFLKGVSQYLQMRHADSSSSSESKKPAAK